MDCNLLPLFELGTVQHAQYLLNIRLPSSNQDVDDDEGPDVKNDIRKLKEISVYVSICVVTSSCRVSLTSTTPSAMLVTIRTPSAMLGTITTSSAMLVTIRTPSAGVSD